MKTKRAYNILFKVISQGFDTVGISFYGHSLILKNISDKEYSLIRYSSYGDKSRYSALKLAYATFMLDGNQVLAERPRSVEDLKNFYLNLPATILDILLSYLEKLERSVLKASEYLEGFCYSTRSRAFWKGVKNQDILSDRVTGVAGTGLLGLGAIHHQWVNYNSALDREEDDRAGWAKSLFVASATNPDGVKKISMSMDQNQKMLKEEREDLVIYGNTHRRRLLKRIKDKKQWAADIKTSEDLVYELNRQMEGKLDKHDSFMQSWYDKIKERNDSAEKAEQDRIAAARANRKKTLSGEISKAVSEQEMLDHISGNKSLNQVRSRHDKGSAQNSDYVHNSHRIISGARR